MHLMPVELDMIVSIGSSGAPTIVSGTGKGIASISRSAAGKYTITLEDVYAAFCALEVTMQSVDASNPSGIDCVELVSESVASAKTMAIVCLARSLVMGAYTPAGTVAAPVFTGSALGTHTHSFTPAGTNANDGPPETFTGTPGTTGATSGGTPAGTNSAPVFTGAAASLTGTISLAAADPANGSKMIVRIKLNNSSIQ